jgi:GPH family glycoside/pentoside/hexuronide:cation symporter
MFTTPSVGDHYKVIYAYVTYSIMMLLYTGISIPYNSMIGVVSPNLEDRASVSSYKFIFAYMAAGSVQFLIVPMVKKFGEGSKAQGFEISMSIFAAIAVALFFVTFFSSKERVEPDPNQSTDIRTDLRDLLNNRPWVVLFFVSLSSLIYIAIRSAAIGYYFKYNLGREDQMGVFMALGTVSTLLGVFPTQWLAAKLGKVRLYQTCFIIVSLSCAGLFFLTPSQIVLVYVLQVVGSLAGGPLFPLLWSMIADTADFSEWCTGRRATGLVFSALTFSQKLGFGIGGWLVMSLFAQSGFTANVAQTAGSAMGIRLSMSIIPAAIALFGAGLLFMYHLDDEQMKVIASGLDERRSMRR